MRHRGSITVFLCLILSVVLSLIGACLEYARGQTVSCQAQMAADSAAESVFAGYHDPLFAQYQLLGRLLPGRDPSGIEEVCRRYADAYGGAGRESGDGALPGGFITEEVSWSELRWLSDENGGIFTRMAVDSMTAAGNVLLVAEWLQRLGFGAAGTEHILSQNAGKESWNLSELMEGYDSWSEAVRRAEEEAARKAAAEKEQQSGAGDSEEPERSGGAEATGSDTDSGVPGSAPRESEESRKVLNLIETMRSLLSREVLDLMLPEGAKLSAGQVPAGERLSGGAGGANTLFFHEYLIRHTDCFTADSEKETAYEAEYLIAGKNTDRENLKAVVTRLFWIRMGMNMLYIGGSPEKNAEAREAAAMAVGWTGQPALVELTKSLILGIWAAAESMVDVRSLLAKRKLPLLKNDATWELALWEMATAGSRGTLAAGGTAESDLSYEDYLRICLFLSSEGQIVGRAMDVVQWNVRKVDPEFRIDSCMVAGSMTLQAASPPVFTSLIGVPGGVGRVACRKVSRFSYVS